MNSTQSNEKLNHFQLIVLSRIDEHKRAEAEKEARIKAEAEEAARLKIEAEAKAEHEKTTEQAVVSGTGFMKVDVDGNSVKATNIPAQDVIDKCIQVIDKALGSDVKHTDTGARIKLGDINAALGFMVTADFLASIGWEPVAKERNSIMYREVDFQEICESLVEHIVAVAGNYDFKKAA